jgi:hypothetical protein
MSDWEISAPTQAQLVTVAKAIVANRNVNLSALNGPDGFVIEGFLNNGTRFCINYYKTKLMPTGNTIVDNPGQTVPEKAPVPGVFAIMRWLHPTNANPPQPPANSGVTLIPLPADSPMKFA